MRIVILYDPGAADWTPEDIRGVMKAVDEIGTIFAALGHEIRKVPVRHDLRWFAVARRADLVFNLCEGVHGKSEWEEHVVGSLEFAGIPVTGASLWTIAACRRKAVANALLAQAGLPIPRWTLAQGKIDDDFPLPAIVKPAAEDASAGLDRGSVVADRKTLRARVAAMTERFDEVLVQEYVTGREFNVGFVGTRALPVAEIDYTGMPEGHWPPGGNTPSWCGASPRRRCARPRGRRPRVSCSLRPVERAHRGTVEALLRATGMFRPSEVETAVQVLDESLAGEDDYRWLGAFDGESLVGCICWGPTPGTEGTYDLYWLVVDPARQGQGLGTELLTAVERRLRAALGRLLVTVTSSRGVFEPTRSFYEHRGYTRAATIPGYYAPGDDLVIYSKDLTDGDLAGTTA